MHNIILSQIDPDKLIESISDKVVERVTHQLIKERAEASYESPLTEYIPKKEVRGKLASASTLWKLEKEGILVSYGIGGKRFYKKADIEKAFIKLDKKRDTL